MKIRGGSPGGLRTISAGTTLLVHTVEKKWLISTTYSEVSIKRPVLLNDLVWIFSKVSIKRPVPSRFDVVSQKNVLSLLKDLVYFFFEKSLLNDLVFFVVVEKSLLKDLVYWFFSKKSLLKDLVYWFFPKSLY